MKDIKEYIYEAKQQQCRIFSHTEGKSIKESIFDDDILDQDHIEEGLIKKFLEENYHIDLNQIEIIKDKSEKYIVNVFNKVYIKNKNIASLTGDLFKFGHISGSFMCSSSKIESLKGAPEKVSENFYLYGCVYLESLEGAPKEVGGDFVCTKCNKLKSLKGAPEKVGGRFECYKCENLESLEGAPKKCKEFDCSRCDKLTSLEGAPKYCNRFYCDECGNLITLKGAPIKTDTFHCSDCPKLMSLDWLPKIKQNLYCSGCGFLMRK